MIFLLPLLWRQASSSPAARATIWLLVATLWLDGLYCLFVNLLLGPMPEARLIHLQLIWRFATQPLVWAAMGLLAGSLLTLLRAAGRAARKPLTA